MKHALLTTGLATLLSAGALATPAAADEAAMPEACKARAAKRLQASPDAIHARSGGQIADRRRLVTGEVETQFGNRRFRCVFDASGRRIVRLTAAMPPRPGLSKRFSRRIGNPLRVFCSVLSAIREN